MKNVLRSDDPTRQGHANLTFVAEIMLLPDGSRYPRYNNGFDCVNETEESLRHLMLYGGLHSCFGTTRLRKLTLEETKQMNAFKSNSDRK